MQQYGRELLDDTIDWSNWARNEINGIPGIYCLDSCRIGKNGIYDLDPTRMTVNFGVAGISGTEAEAILRKEFSIQVEMSDLYNIVAITTIGDNKGDYEKFVNALKSIKGIGTGKAIAAAAAAKAFLKPPELSLMPWEALYCKKIWMKAEESIGRISGEMIIPYPPGIPVLVPGEIITREAYDYLKLCVKQDVKINGASDTKLEKIWVIK